MSTPWEQLPRKIISSGAFLLNGENELLIVKPTYKEGWGLAGGIVDAEESVTAACARELKEELGLSKEPQRLLCIDYVEKHLQRSGHDALHFVFYCGKLTAEEIEQIELPPEELSEYKFIKQSEMGDYFSERLVNRFENCHKTLESNKPLLLRNGAALFA